MPDNARILVTGGPGAGKTTLLLALQARGHTIASDSAREIIRERRQRGLSPRPPALEFAQQVLRRDIEGFVRHAATPGPVFFDRGVVDALALLDQAAPLGERELSSRLAMYRYATTAFLLPAWQAIYTCDDERDQPFEHAQWVEHCTRDWYRRCGYRLVELPKVPVAQRCELVLRTLSGKIPALKGFGAAHAVRP